MGQLVNMPFPSQKRQRILWMQVWGLALVQGAIALTWVIYNLYLVDLLTRFGLPKSWAVGLLVFENILAILMEPLMGSLSDRLQRQVGSRFLLVALGSILSAGLFLAIPLLVTFGTEGVRWLLPAVLVAWALAMTVFRSPALSLLGQYAFATQLPAAASILTLVGGLAGAAGPLAGPFILGLGPVAAFSVGSAVLLVAAGVLRQTQPNQTLFAETTHLNGKQDSPRISPRQLALAFGAGLGVTLGFRLMMLMFPSVLSTRFPSTPTQWVIGLLFVTLAATAIPAGTLATRWGNAQAMFGGLIGMALFCALAAITPSLGIGVAVAIAFGAAFSLVSNGTIPFALSMAPSDRHGLGTGMYFGGAALASSLFSGVAQRLTGQIFWMSLLGVLAFLVAAACVVMGSKIRGTAP
ncbi:MAG TPA: MFS transporter [Leptolyngbyaceae cyanobacterium]